MLENTNYIYGDYTEADYDRSHLAAHDALVFSTSRDWRDRPKDDVWEYFRKKNVEATGRFFKEANDAGVRRSVLISSYYHAIYPELIKKEPYIWSRAETENAVLDACNKMHVSIIQPPWVMGPNSGVGMTFGQLVTNMAKSSFPLIAIPGGTTWISATSLAYATAEALERGKNGERYLVGDEFCSWAKILETFSQYSGKKRKAHVVPRPVMRLVGLSAFLYLRLKRVKSPWDERNFVKTLCSEAIVNAERSQRSHKELNYPVKDIERAMRETFTYCNTL